MSTAATASSGSGPAHGPNLDHPMFKLVKEAFAGKSLRATEFRGMSTLVVEPSDLHEVLAFLKNDPRANYVMLSDVGGFDYLNYPAPQPGRFAVVYNLICFDRDERFFVKTFLNPSLPTDGIVEDPALWLDSVCD
ncbi:MAG: NADH-quinone oxidoreductase subunit C, partial [Planctomycetota bacterium]